MIGPGDRGLVASEAIWITVPGGRDVKLTTFSLPPRTTFLACSARCISVAILPDR